MGSKLVTEVDKRIIPMNELEDGQVAVIVAMHSSDRAGSIVQCLKKYDCELPYFIIIGDRCGCHYDYNCTLNVRVLEAGEQIEIT